MNKNRKRKVLSLRDKLDVILSIHNGESGKFLSLKYGVGASTISDIKKNSSKIIDYSSRLCENDGNLSRKIMKESTNPGMDQAVFKWFVQKRSTGQPISGSLLREKAKSIHELSNCVTHFQASSGWLQRFKSRHGIRSLRICGDKLSADVKASNTFVDTLHDIINESKYTKDFIYNADETRLDYKALPSKSLVLRNESAAPGFKTSKESVTVLVCANASGTHRLPLLVIGKSKNREIFNSMPISYKYTRKAWINQKIFTEWYEETFVPQVQQFHGLNDNHGNVLLLLDNAPCHPPATVLNIIHNSFTIKYLPPNVTSIIQPMDQGVIENFKRIYRKDFLRYIILEDDNQHSIRSIIKNLKVDTCCQLMIDAWNRIDSKTLERSWNKILK